jgi:methylmalonyl-CoA mutase C-terminal domain/subunit
MQDNDMQDVPMFIGGIIPNEDIPRLKEMGVAAVFGPGTTTAEIISCIQETVQGERAS